MRQVLHGYDRTTAAVRRTSQSSQQSLIALAELNTSHGAEVCYLPALFD